MKKLRLVTQVLLITIITIIAITGCDKSTKSPLDPKNPVEIVIWHYYHGAQKNAFDDMVNEFNETVGYTQGIIVGTVGYGGVNELADTVVASAKGELDAGSMPNIFSAYGDTALEIVSMGKAAEINKYITEEELAEYPDSFIHEGKLGTDNFYVFPVAKSTESLMLNKTDFDAFADGLKSSGFNETVDYDDLATFEGILKVAELYYRYTDSLTPDVDNDGKAFMGIDSLANYLIVGSKQLGQDLVKVENGNATINLDTNIMLKLWDTYYEPIVTGKFAKLGKFCSDDIKTGDSLCYIGATSSSSYFPLELYLENDTIRQIELLALPMPVFEGGSKISVSQGAGMAIAKSDEKREYASTVFLKWFTDSERNISFSLNSSYLPVKRKSLDAELFNEAFEAVAADDRSAQNTIKTLRVGLHQLQAYTLYSSDVFDGGTAFRNNLPMSLSDAALEDRKAYLDLLNDGAAPEQAYDSLRAESRKKFEQWIKFLKE